MLRAIKRVRPSLVFFILVFFQQVAWGQNLVPNPGFETNTGCPSGWSQINLAGPWGSPSFGTPDYYNSCAVVPDLGVPVSVSGYAQAHGGNAYAGIITYTDTVVNVGALFYVEYLQVQLTAPLQAGQCYFVKFWVQCAEGTPALIGPDPNINGLSTMVSAYLSVQPPSAPGWFGVLPINGSPQITSVVTVNDTSSWTLVSAIYTATGGENYLTIGNWNMSLVGNGPVNATGPFEPCTAYYFIDDVEVTPLPLLTLGSDQPICPGDQIVLQATPGASSYLWSTGATASSITVTAAGSYWVEQTSGSCVQNDTIVVYDGNCPGPAPVIPDCFFYIPNSFTPNSDGLNDAFGAKGENINDFHLLLFDRWGKLVFETSDISRHWDGTYRGEQALVDIYAYSLHYKCGNEYYRRYGHVALIR